MILLLPKSKISSLCLSSKVMIQPIIVGQGLKPKERFSHDTALMVKASFSEILITEKLKGV